MEGFKFRYVYRLALSAIVCLSACATVDSPPFAEPQTEIPAQIPPLHGTGNSLNTAFWKPMTIPLKRKTEYKGVKHQGKIAIRANAKSSASGIAAKLDVDLTKTSNIVFNWYADALIVGADNSERNTEDSPLRIILSFDGDKSTLSGKEQRFHDRAKLLTGREMPYATLMYIWENNQPVDAVLTNPHTSTIKKVVVSSGPGDLMKWKAFKRNIVKDYTDAFGKLPGKLTGIALMTDTDNTGTNITAYYSDIRLVE